jgi:hypothetical protein
MGEKRPDIATANRGSGKGGEDLPIRKEPRFQTNLNQNSRVHRFGSGGKNCCRNPRRPGKRRKGALPEQEACRAGARSGDERRGGRRGRLERHHASVRRRALLSDRQRASDPCGRNELKLKRSNRKRGRVSVDRTRWWVPALLGVWWAVSSAASGPSAVDPTAVDGRVMLGYWTHRHHLGPEAQHRKSPEVARNLMNVKVQFFRRFMYAWASFVAAR